MRTIEVSQMIESGMPCAGSMSKAMHGEQPAVCHAHCQSAQTIWDTPQPPSALNLAAIGLLLGILVQPPAGDAPAGFLVR